MPRMTTGRPDAPSPLERFALPALLATAVLLRLREALRTPLWFDELYTLDLARRPWGEMLSLLPADVHPPLHYVLVWLWCRVAPWDVALRGLSIAAAVGALYVAFLLVREMLGRPAAWIVAAFLAVHPWHVYVSQEMRSYALLWLALGLSALGAWRWSEHGRRPDALLFVAASAAAMWTHYLAGVVVFAQWLWGVARFAREPRRLFQWVLLHAAIGGLFAALMPLLWMQLHRVEVDFWLKPPTLGSLFDFARRCSFGNARVAIPVALVAALAFVDRRAWRATTFAFAIGPLAVIACWWLGTHGIHIFAVKYMMFALPGMFTLLAAGLLRLPGRWTRGVAIAALVVLAGRALALQPVNSEASSNAVARTWLAARVRDGDVIFHADPHTLLFAQRYFPHARNRLLPMRQRVPYFDGAAVVTAREVASAEEVHAVDAAGGRWFGMVWGRGGVKPAAAVALFDSLAAAPPDTCGLERLWHGRGIAAPAAAR